MNFFDRLQSFLKDRFEQMHDLHQAMTQPQRIGLYSLGFAFAFFVAMLLVWNSGPGLVPLPTGPLDADKLASIQAEMNRQGVKYEIDAQGRILVHPADKTRLAFQLVEKDLIDEPSRITFESIFEKQSFMRTKAEFDEQVKQALETKLRRVIEGFAFVHRANVIVTPKKEEPFVRDQEPPTATVVLHLQRGAKLTDQRVSAVANVISGAVQGMSPGNVKISDANGRVYVVADDESVVSLGSDRLDLKRDVEAYFVKKAKHILARAAGDVDVVVDVELDLDRIERMLRDVKTDDIVPKSQDITTRRDQNTEKEPGGPAGTSSTVNLPATPPGLAAGTSNSLVEEESIKVENDYDLTVENITSIPGSIKDMTVAVVVPIEAASESAEITAEELERRNQQAKDYRDLIMGALNIRDPAKVIVKIMPKAPLPVFPVVQENWMQTSARMLERYGNQVLLLILLLAGVVMLRANMKRAEVPEYPEPGMEGADVAEQPQFDVSMLDLDEITEGELRAKEVERRVLAIIEEDPEHTASFLRRWIMQDITE